MLDQGAALEQGDLGDLRTDVHADHVAPDGLAPPLPSRPGGPRPRPRRRPGPGSRQRAQRRCTGRPLPRASSAPASAPTTSLAATAGRPASGRRAVPAPRVGRGAGCPARVTGRAGRLSPIFGRSGTARGATAGGPSARPSAPLAPSAAGAAGTAASSDGPAAPSPPAAPRPRRTSLGLPGSRAACGSGSGRRSGPRSPLAYAITLRADRARGRSVTVRAVSRRRACPYRRT